MAVIQFVNKWIHLLSITATLGGIVFGWTVLAPALRDEAVRGTDLARSLWRRFGLTLAVTWLIVLATGFLNYYLVSPNVAPAYHMLVGMKIILVLLMFVISMALAHPMKAFEKVKANRAPWLLATALLGLLVLGISTELNTGRMNGSLLKKTEAQPLTSPPATGAPAAPPSGQPSR